MGELIVILIVALLFIGPDKLPDAAKSISKGIRDFRKQTRELQQTLEDDDEIGGAIRDLKSALRGEELTSEQARELQRRAEAERKKAAEGDRSNRTAVASARVGGGTDSEASGVPDSTDDDAPAAGDDLPVIRPPSGTIASTRRPGISAAEERPVSASDSAPDSDEAHG